MNTALRANTAAYTDAVTIGNKETIATTTTGAISQKTDRDNHTHTMTLQTHTHKGLHV